jgi:hypothetical protein
LKVTIETRKTKAEINRILHENTARPELFHTDNTKYFVGDILPDTFKIHRIIRYRNSFLPIIMGKIEEVDGGHNINLKIRMIIGVIIFLIFWLTPFLVLSIASIINFIKARAIVFDLPHFAPFTGPIVFIGVYLHYRFEAKLAVNKLKKLFE